MSINARMTWNEGGNTGKRYAWYAEAFDTTTGAEFMAFGHNPEEAMKRLTEQVRKHVADSDTYTEYVYDFEAGFSGSTHERPRLLHGGHRPDR